MRVVAGELGGRRLEAPRGTEVRPTSDRVRESVFASLVTLGAVHDARVLDLFAGTGALGIEAISRGAASATFVERHGDAFAALTTNLEVLGLAGDPRVTVHRGDALRVAAHVGPFDLVLLDPPYAFEQWAELLAAVERLVDPDHGGLVVIEKGRRTDVVLPEGWESVRDKRYGSTVVVMAQVPGSSGSPTPGSDGR